MTTNMRQRFARMGHVARRNMGLTEKTQVLSNDLKEVEKRVELIGHACKKTSAKLQNCLQGTGQDAEKRTRRLPYSVLSQSMQDASQELGDNSIFGLALGRTSEACSSIALELTSHEMGIENLVLTPFNSALDNDIPSIQEKRKKLKSLTIDMEAAKSSYTQAQRATSGGRNMQEHSIKVEQLREQYDVSQMKVEGAKESLATEMMTLVAKEGEFARNLLDMVEAQAQYHRNALVRLEGLIPRMKELLDQDPTQPVYGIPLEEHLKIRESDIAEPIQMCIFWLLELGIDEEGLFRIAGTTTKVKMIKAAFDSNVQLDMSDLYGSVHAVAGAFKQYLRDLPEPLLTFKLYDEFIQAGSIKDNDQKLQALWTAINKLPKPNYNNFRYLIKFLDRVVKRSDVNKMTAANLSIVFAPNLLWSKEEGGVSVLSTGIASAVVELFIAYADWFFPGDINFDLPEDTEANMSSSSDQPDMRSPSPPLNASTTPNASTPERPERPQQPLPSVSQSPVSPPSQAALQLAVELQQQSKPPARPPSSSQPAKQDGNGTPPAVPDRDSDTLRSLSATEKEMAKRLGFLNVPVNKLKSASLPRRSTKSRHAPAPPKIPGQSPPSNLKRRSADSGINNSNDTLNSIDSSSSATTSSMTNPPLPPTPPTRADIPTPPTRTDIPTPPTRSDVPTPPVRADIPTPPTRSDIPAPPTRADKPPVPHKNSLGRDAKLPTSPVSPGAPDVQPPLSSLPPKPKPPAVVRPTMSPPPPPPKLDASNHQESFDTPM